MQIYLARNNVQAGPYTLEQLNTMIASGEVLLNDLAWHDGMEEWKKLGDITNGRSFYDPNGDLTKLQDIFDQITHDSNKHKKTSDNEHPETDKNRLTVDQLYGRKPSTNSSDISNKNEHNENKKQKESTTKVIRVQIGKIPKINDDLLANRFQRISASLIDWLTILMICLPIFMRVDMEKFNEVSASAMTMAEKMAASQELAQQIPPHIAMMCNLLFLGFMVVQSVLLLRRGQTIGKLVMGIRILDFSSHQLASPTKVLLLRSIVTTFSYLTFPLLLLVDTIYMFINRNRRSIHDKIAGTYVAKANDEQIPKKEDNQAK